MSVRESVSVRVDRARRRLQKPALFLVKGQLGICLSYYYKPHDITFSFRLIPPERRPGYRR